PDPLQDVQVGGVGAVLAARAAVRGGRAPKVFAGRIQGGAGKVQPIGRAVGPEGLRLQASQDAQGLRVALEAADAGRGLVESSLAIVAVGRVADIVAEPRQVRQVGVRAQGFADAAGDLSDL